MVADVLWACGDIDRALRSAEDGLANCGDRPLRASYMGMFGRWVGLTAVAEERAETALAVLEEISKDPESTEMVDRAELLGIRLTVNSHRGVQWLDGQRQLGEVLTRLPHAVELQIRRLGALNF
jgi:hypothetical protein